MTGIRYQIVDSGTVVFTTTSEFAAKSYARSCAGKYKPEYRTKLVKVEQVTPIDFEDHHRRHATYPGCVPCVCGLMFGSVEEHGEHADKMREDES